MNAEVRFTLAQALQTAVAAYNKRDWATAEQLSRLLLDAQADHFEALNLLGIIAAQTRRPKEAADWLRRAVTARPGDAGAHNNYGNALIQLKRFEEALDSCTQALRIKPEYAAAHYNRGTALQELERFEEALHSYALALQIQPNYLEVHYNRGNTLQRLRRFEDALASYAHALSINPHYAEAYNNGGTALQQLGRVEEALDSYAQALKINPHYAEAYNNRGNALHLLKRFEDALDSYAHALRINPDFEWLYGTWLHTKMRLCDWSNFESRLAELAANIQEAKKITLPFFVLSLIDSSSLQRQAAATYVRERHPPSRLLPPIAKHARRERIRIGYFSADYRVHPVSLLAAEMIEGHDRSRFEVTAFSFGPNTRDEVRKRMERAFDRFIDVRANMDVDIVQLARSMELDIAIDLGGFTEGCRPNVFALRAAPLQVSYLGYAGTTSAEYIDYLVADRTVIPQDNVGSYSEKIVYLPHTYMPNDSKRTIADTVYTREDCGLPRTGFIFCCFNNAYKIMPGTFDCWMRILSRVENSVLWLSWDNPGAATNLQRRAAESGVSPHRIIFAQRLERSSEYLARLRVADLFLDTLPYNAHATASDALWVGLPLLTCIGETYAGRVAASLLGAVGLPELITTAQEHYEAKAIELAGEPRRLAEFRNRLHLNRLKTPLFDTKRYTRHLENAYAQMYERYQADLGPENIHVEQIAS